MSRFFEWTPDDAPAVILETSSEDAWDQLRSWYAPNAPAPPLERIIEIAKSHGVAAVLVERRYIDAARSAVSEKISNIGLTEETRSCSLLTEQRRNMTKLHQVLAADKDIKKRTDRKITDAYQRLQKPDLYSGLSRTYTPKDENGEVLPPQTQILQRRVSDEFEVIEQEWTDQINSAATKDFANTQAKADIVVDGETILAGAPVPFLLWLEGEIRRMIPVVTVAPILDPSEKWEYSDESRSYETNTTRTLRTTKQNVPLVLAEATDKHPAQVQVFQQDVVVGSWDSKRMSGALSATEHEARLDRFGKLLIAVQQARAEANEIAVTPSQAGEAVTSYLFG